MGKCAQKSDFYMYIDIKLPMVSIKSLAMTLFDLERNKGLRGQAMESN